MQQGQKVSSFAIKLEDFKSIYMLSTGQYHEEARKPIMRDNAEKVN